ncbi:MAG: tetratricopeptide repeat protein [Planctomycetota bacterium]|jgi:tetratricopeptide (TPR) repeat protein
MAERGEVTRILRAIGQGETDRVAELLDVVYAELRGMAERRMAGERPGQTLQPTALVHEAYLQLAGDLAFDNRAHFFGAAGEAMRRILIDRARARATAKRGDARRDMGDLAGALAEQQAVLAGRRRTLPDEHPDIATSLSETGLLLDMLDRGDEAIPLLREAIERLVAALGAEHEDTIQAKGNLAAAFQRTGRLDEAETLTREVLALRRRLGGDEDDRTLVTLNNLGALLRARGKHDEAAGILTDVVAAQHRVSGPRHPVTLGGTHNLASALKDAGRLEEAAARARTALEGARETLPPGHHYTGIFQGNYGDCLRRLGRLDEAEPELLASHGALESALGADHTKTRQVAGYLAALHEARGDAPQAEAWRARSEPDSGR